MTPQQKAELIVKRIKADFTDRDGLRQEWDGIDNDIQQEIIEKWRSIVFEVIVEA